MLQPLVTERLPDNQLPNGSETKLALVGRHKRPAEPSRRRHAALLGGTEVLATHRGACGVVRKFQA